MDFVVYGSCYGYIAHCFLFILYEWEKVTKEEQMKTTKDECDKAYEEKRLELSDKKCKECEFYHTCKYIFWSYEDVIYGE